MKNFDLQLKDLRLENKVNRQLIQALMKELGYEDYHIKGDTQGFTCELVKETKAAHQPGGNT